MTFDPGVQGAPAEAPVPPASPDPDAEGRAASDAVAHDGAGTASVPDSLRMQILSTEHWSLLATRSLTWNESFARAQMFLSALSAGVVALALVAQATSFGDGFIAFALVILPVIAFLGFATFIRLVAANADEGRWVRGMNRIRSAYLTLAPDLERYFVTSQHDDARGAMLTAGWTGFPTLLGLVTTPGVVMVIDGVVVAIFVFVATTWLGLAVALDAALGGLVFLVWTAVLTIYVRRDRLRRAGTLQPLSPTPTGDR